MAETLNFTSSADGIDSKALAGGFFQGWTAAPSPGEHLALLRGSQYVALALDEERVVGFANGLSDRVLSAYIPLLEVLPDYRHQGVGSRLIQMLLADIGPLYMVDVMCDEDVLPFYEQLGFQRANGAVRRNYSWRSSPARSPGVHHGFAPPATAAGPTMRSWTLGSRR